MEVTEEEFGGVLVVCKKGDNLRSVPKSHRRLITPEIESWWHDPLAAIQNVAVRSVTPLMGAWFRTMAERGEWQLELHRASRSMGCGVRAGFWLSAPGIRGAEVSPPSQKQCLDDNIPPDLANYYALVGYVDWMGFGASGGLEGGESHTPLTQYRYDYHGDAVEPADTFIFGWSPCGDMIIYTTDGRGGWVCHDNGKVHLLGSVADTLDWVYGELMEDRCPDYDNSWD